MAHLIDINIVHSTTGGTPGESSAYDREITIGRIQQTIADLVSEHIPRGQISTVKMRIKKPGGSVRRMVRGAAGIQVITIQLKIAVGTIQDMDRAEMIRSCQVAVPDLVIANVPSHHLCSLVIGYRDSSRDRV